MSNLIMGKTMIRLFLKYSEKYWLRIGISILFGSLTVISVVGLMGTSAYLIIMAGFHPSIAILQTSIVGVRFFGISRSIFRYLERLTAHSVNFQILGEIRLQLFKQISSRFTRLLDRYSGSEILSIIINDINMMENLFVRLMSPIFVAFLISLGVGLFIGMKTIELVYVYTFGFLLIGFAVPALSIRVSKLSGGEFESAKIEYQSDVINFIQFFQEAVFYQAESRLISKLRQSEKKLQDKHKVKGIWQSFWNMLSYFSIQGIFLSALVLSGWMVKEGKLDSVMLGVMSLIILSSFEVLANIPAVSYLYGDLTTSSNRIMEIGKIPEQLNDYNYLIIKKITPIVLENVSYSYLNNQEIKAISDINLNINQGEKIAIVGMNGAGKTTLVEILLGLRKDYLGQIFFNGQDLKRIHNDLVRAKISYVSANPYAFSTSVRQNLLLAKKNIDDKTLINILESVNLYNPPIFDLETHLDEFGKNLSSGELQKLSIAQSLLVDGEIVMFDEPFANLDPIIASDLFDLIENLFCKKTILFITHNLKNMNFFDRIIVLDQGRIIESGDHDTLKKQNGIYRKLLRINLKSDF